MIYIKTFISSIVFLALLAIIIILNIAIKKYKIKSTKGCLSLKVGLVLINFGMLYDILEDHIPNLQDSMSFIFFGIVIGYLLGFVLVGRGLWLWLPEIAYMRSSIDLITKTSHDIREKVEGFTNNSCSESKKKSRYLKKIENELEYQMNIISGYVEILLNMDVPDIQKKVLKETTYSAENINFLISNIKEINNSNGFRNNKETANLNFLDLKNHLEFSYGRIADNKDIDLFIDIESRLKSKQFNGPKNEIIKIVEKFVETSLICTDGGFIKVDIYPGIKVDGVSYVNIQFADSGNPFPENYLDKMGDYFAEEITVLNSNPRLNLGMNVAYNLLRQINADIKVDRMKPPNNEIIHLSIPLKTP